MFVNFFIRRPVATILLTLAIALPGMLAYALLPLRARQLAPGLLVAGVVGIPGAATTVLAAATTEGRRIEALFQLERFKDVAETTPPHMIEYAAARNALGR